MNRAYTKYDIERVNLIYARNPKAKLNSVLAAAGFSSRGAFKKCCERFGYEKAPTVYIEKSEPSQK